MIHHLIGPVGVAFYSSLVLLLLWALFFYLWRDYQIQAFRQNLFELRSRLFEFAKAGNVAFGDGIYRALRLHINALIRYAYHISFTTVVVTLMFRKFDHSAKTTSLADRIWADSRLSDSQKKELAGIYSELIWACARQIAQTSILAWPCLAAFMSWVKIKSMVTNVSPTLELPGPMLRHLQYLESQAVEVEEKNTRGQTVAAGA